MGTPVGTAATATIGAGGGRLRSPDGRLSLDVPAGALAADAAVTIQPVTNTAHGGRGTSYLLGPDGQIFRRPVTLTFAYGDDEVAGSAPGALSIVFQTAERHWRLVETRRDAAARTLTAMVSHFSTWAVATRMRLRPASARVGVGKSLTLVTEFCFPIEDRAAAQGVGPSGFSCRPMGPSMGLLFKDWAVNGVPGGDALVGTIEPSAEQARFTAPAVRPQPTTVRVSVNYTNDGAYPLSSNVTIVDVPQRMNATYALDYSLQAPDYTESFHVEGTIVFDDPNGGPNVYTYTAGRGDVTGAMTDYVKDHVLFRCTSQGGRISSSSAGLVLRFDPAGSYVSASLRGRFPTSCTSKTGNPPYTSQAPLNAEFGVGAGNDTACEVLYASAATSTVPGRVSFPDSVSGRAHYTCDTTYGRKTVTVSWTAASPP